jgi:Phosphoglycerol transferase and related proteins, alkaline phosphatase superfamily
MALSLTAILILAKILWLLGRHVPFSFWLPAALLWQDVVVGLLFALLVRRAGWRPYVWLTYAALVVWIALNIPIARTLSSPLTVPMLRATGGPLADSIALYVTPVNVAMILLVVVTGAILPRLAVSNRATMTVAAAMIAIALPGPFVAARVDAAGTDRNALTSLILTAMPRMAASPVRTGGDWRTSPFGAVRGDDLGWLARSAAGRNVVMVFLESTGASYLRSYGAPDDPMPTVTALANEGVLFERAYAAYPESIKGLFGVMCSRHPGLDVSVEVHARAPCTPLPRVLADAGYQTALFHSGRFAYLGMQAIVSTQGWGTLEDAGAIGGQVESSFGVDEPSTVARALSWIDARDRARPFFLAYMPIAGHHPYEAPTRGPFSGEGEVSAYKNALRYADTSVATLLAGLKSRGLDRQTMLVIFGDHGEAFGQHEGNFGHTFFTFEENVHVPLLISIPGVTAHAVRDRQMASVVDIAPTILALTGTATPGNYEGASLLTGDNRLAFFYTDYALAWAGLRDGCWKYLLEIEAKRSRLFNLCEDAAESRDLAAAHPDRIDAYRQRTVAWIASTRQKYVE